MISLRTRLAVIVVAAVAVYWNGLSAPFLLDDHTSILTNHSIESLALPGPLVTPSDTPVARRPLVNLSFAVNYALGQRDVRGYHLGNLAIHVLAALVLFGIVRRTLTLPPLDATYGEAATSLAWVSALVWVLHPLNSEIVDYVTQRTQGMLGLLYLLTLYCAIRAARARRGRRWDAAAVLSCAAGMLCKEAMITAPLMVALYDRVFLFDSLKTALSRRARLYSGLAASWLVLGLAIRSSARTSAGFGTGVTSWDYLLNQARMIPHYLYLVVWPRSLVVDYGPTQPIPLASVILPGVLIVLAAAVVLIGLMRWPRLSFPGAWFFVTLAPASSVVPIATEVGAERRMYLPLAALAVVLVLVTYRVAIRMRADGVPLRVACAVVIGFLAFGTIVRNHEYRDPVRLAEAGVERWPNGRAYVTLGTLYGERGDRAAELRQYRLAAEAYPPGHYTLGVALVENHQEDEGLAHLRAFVEQNPRHIAVPPARDLIGRLLVNRGDLEGASRQFEQILAHDPANARALVLLADVRLRQQRNGEAITLYERAHRVDGSLARSAPVMARFGTALASANRLADAERIFAEGARANPQDSTLQKLWGRALAASGRFSAAAERFRRARSLAPNDAEAIELVAAIERRVGVASR